MKIPHNIYMVGIGGIGMSALAQLLKYQGKEMGGSDREESPVTDMLKRQGFKVFFGHSAENISNNTELLIYSDAVPEDNLERVAARKKDISECSYFQALGEVSKKYRTVAVAGTHGKTTTAAMLATILKAAEKEPTAIIGSVVNEWGSNFLAGRSNVLVVEACEYKKHFLEFRPEVLVVTNVEWDHTDYYKTPEEFEAAFAEARKQAKKVIEKDEYAKELVPELLLPGEFNRDNACAAKSGARAMFPELPDTVADEALRNFKGVWRRFEYKGKTKEGDLVYDDYAHHPTAIRKTLEAARVKFPDKKIIVAFHPHLYTRTRDLMNDFAHVLSLADEVVIAPIYAAREEPVAGVTSEALAKRISALGVPAKALSSSHDVYMYLTTNYELQSTNRLIITMGAGDIYKVADRLVAGT